MTSILSVYGLLKSGSIYSIFYQHEWMHYQRESGDEDVWRSTCWTKAKVQFDFVFIFQSIFNQHCSRHLFIEYVTVVLRKSVYQFTSLDANCYLVPAKLWTRLSAILVCNDEAFRLNTVYSEYQFTKHRHFFCGQFNWTLGTQHLI